MPFYWEFQYFQLKDEGEAFSFKSWECLIVIRTENGTIKFLETWLPSQGGMGLGEEHAGAGVHMCHKHSSSLVLGGQSVPLASNYSG